MDRFLNAIKRAGAQMDSNRNHPQYGVVVSYDPTTARCRVNLQPENELTGWLPVSFPSVSSGGGCIVPPVQGQQVLVAFEGGERDSGVVLGASYSDVSPAPKGYNNASVQSGEYAFINAMGSLFHMLANGDMHIVSPTTITIGVGANVLTINSSGFSFSGDVIQTAGTIKSANDIIANNDISLATHTHSGVESGSSNTDGPNA